MSVMDNGGAFTDRLFAQAAISQGGTALDIGCGGGDVTFRLSRAVGPRSEVMGLDLNAKVLGFARERATELGLSNTRFLERDFRDVVQDGQRFDVVTCRRVLMYLPDQLEAVGAMRRLLKPNGVLLIQEHDAAMRQPSPDRPLSDQAQRWIWETVEAEGANSGTGFQLHSLLSSAGFSDISIFAEAVVETPSQAAQTYPIVRAMLPRIEGAGVATAAEIDIDTLDHRLSAERAKSVSTSITEMMFGAIARAT